MTYRNKEKKKATDRRYRLLNKEKLREQRLLRRKNNPEEYKRRGRLKRQREKEKFGYNLKKYQALAYQKKLQKVYGLTLEQYNQMFVSQNGKCKICNESQEKRLCVDHCHKTGKVRGLLCSNCNFGIAFLKDDPNLLLSAIKYLN